MVKVLGSFFMIPLFLEPEFQHVPTMRSAVMHRAKNCRQMLLVRPPFDS